MKAFLVWPLLAVMSLLAQAGCGDGSAAHADAAVFPDAGADDVAAEFRPAPRPIGELSGLSYLPPRGTSPAEQATRDDDLQRLPAAGLRTLRHDFLWAEIEPERGRYVFDAYDRVVDAARAAGLEIIPILAYGAPWAAAASGGDPHYPPDDPQDFADYVSATVGHFKERIHTWEIWNEENSGFRFWKPREDPASYGALLAAAATAARAADPGATIVLGGLFYHPQLITGAEAFLDALYTAHPDIGASYDVLGLHPYPSYPPTAAPEETMPPEVPLPLMVARMRAVLRRHGDDKPIYVTEYGWPVYGGVDETRQARYLVRGFLLLAASGVDRTLWFTLRDGPDFAAFPPEDAFGLLRYDSDPTDAEPAAPKLAWQACEVLLGTVGDAVLVEDRREELGLDEWSFAYRLQSASRSVTVLWHALDDEVNGVVQQVPRRPGTAVRLLSMLGEELSLPAAGTDVVTIRVTPDPVYLVEE